MNFGEVLTRAWNIIWKNKILWVFGLLASLGGGSGGGGSSNFRFNNTNQNGQFYFPGLERFFNNIPAWAIILLVLLAIFLIVVFIILSTIGRAGLVRGAWIADGGETHLTFSRLFSEGSVYFWRVLLLGILTFVVSLSLILVITIPTVLAAVLTFGIALICLLPLICLLVPVFIAMTVIFELAIIGIVGEDLGVIDSLRRAWSIFTSHLAEIIGIGVILVIIGAVVGFLTSLPALALLAPLAVAFMAASNSVTQASIVVALVLFVIYLPILLAIRAVMTSYVDTTWTVTFRRLTGRGPSPVETPIQPAQ